MYCLEALLKRLQRASSELKEILGEGFTGLMLFGSYARGEAREDSDVDILVVLKGLKGMRIRSIIYKVIVDNIGLPITLVDIDLRELAREDLEVTPLLLNILYDGIIVYDETGILARLKSKIKELVSKAKLVRYKTPNGKYGWKRINGKPLEEVKV